MYEDLLHDDCCMKISLILPFKIVHGRISACVEGCRSLDLFIQKDDGKKIGDKDNLGALCSRLKEEMLHPLRVVITNRDPDTELLVANPVELSGKGRTRVFYDVTLALKTRDMRLFGRDRKTLDIKSPMGSVYTRESLVTGIEVRCFHDLFNTLLEVIGLERILQ